MPQKVFPIYRISAGIGYHPCFLTFVTVFQTNCLYTWYCYIMNDKTLVNCVSKLVGRKRLEEFTVQPIMIQVAK